MQERERVMYAPAGHQPYMELLQVSLQVSPLTQLKDGRKGGVVNLSVDAYTDIHTHTYSERGTTTSTSTPTQSDTETHDSWHPLPHTDTAAVLASHCSEMVRLSKC